VGGKETGFLPASLFLSKGLGKKPGFWDAGLRCGDGVKWECYPEVVAPC